MQRHLIWWSAGAASTVAAKIHLEEHPDAELIYTDPGSEDPDNVRFRRDVEEWLGAEIRVLRSDKYVDTWNVWANTNYLVGVSGTRCTIELKKRLRQKIEDPTDIQVFGYTAEEQHRVDRFRQANPDVNIVAPLIERGITKPQCLGELVKAGIELPRMYTLGFRNANCIGCPHGGMGYWNMIRVHYPEAFDRMAKEERRIGHACNKDANGPVWLDELDPTRGDILTEPDIDCGPLCIMDSSDGQMSLLAPSSSANSFS